MDEMPTQKRKRLELRDLHRDGLCKGCRYNFYNWPKSSNGWDAEVPDGYSCWYLAQIKRGKCPGRSPAY